MSKFHVGETVSVLGTVLSWEGVVKIVDDTPGAIIYTVVPKIGGDPKKVPENRLRPTTSADVGGRLR